MSQSGQQQQSPYMPTSGAQYSYGQPSYGQPQQPSYAYMGGNPSQPVNVGGSSGSSGKPQSGAGIGQMPPPSFNPGTQGIPDYYQGAGAANQQSTNAAMLAAQMAMQHGMNPQATMQTTMPGIGQPTGSNVTNPNPSWLNFFGGPQAQQAYAQSPASGQQVDPNIWGPNGPSWTG